MALINKSKLTDNYSVLPNEIINNGSLSFRAKGILWYMLSKPEDWEVHVTEIAKNGKEGTDAIYTSLRELIEAGYVIKEQKNTKGKFGTVNYYIYDTPQTDSSKAVPLRDLPFPVKRQLLSTDSILSTDISKDIRKSSYKNNNVTLLSQLLIEKYPIDISGITDRRILHSLVQVCSPRKNRDEWMNTDWKVNLGTFLKTYLRETDEQYLVRSVARLKDLVKDWRERGGYKQKSTKVLVS